MLFSNRWNFRVSELTLFCKQAQNLCMFTDDQEVVMFNGPTTFCDRHKDTESFQNYGCPHVFTLVSQIVLLRNPGTQGSVHAAQ